MRYPPALLIVSFILLAAFLTGSAQFSQEMFGSSAATHPFELTNAEFTLPQFIPDIFSLTPITEKFMAFSALAQTEAPFNASQTRTYKICGNGTCLVKKGKGINQCRTDADCVTSHTACMGDRCILVYEPGQDECALGQSCAAVSHKACRDLGLGPFCAVVAGPPRAGEVLCAENDDCPDDDEAAVPDLTPAPNLIPPNFCGSNGSDCQCANGALPIDPSLIKRFNSTVHGEPGSGHGWAICGSGYCAVDLNVGATADEAYAVASRGVPIYSPINGKVIAASIGDRFGNCIIILGGQNETALCHTVPSVSVGQSVTAGQQVGTLKAYWGDFGPHLHFELKINGKWIMGDGKIGTWINQQNALGCPISPRLTVSPSSLTADTISPSLLCTTGTGLCSPSSLRDTFITKQASDDASIICSAGNGSPFALNDSCLCGTSQEHLVKNADCSRGTTGDYSVGLFQINLIAGNGRCSEALIPIDTNGVFVPDGPYCRILNQAALDSCARDIWGYGDPSLNERKAYEISKRGTDWGEWSVGEECSIPKNS